MENKTMRTIKFRGKTLFGGNWIYGDLIQNKTFNKYAIVPQDNEWHDYPLFEVDPKTIGQFTGVKDSVGRDIYEGDIMEEEHSSIKTLGVVNFSNGQFLIDYKRKGKYRIDERIGYYGANVIGNIYDNPELIEATKWHT